jgi:hypothetical protein
MAQARSAATTLAQPRVQVIAPAHLGETAIAALRARGIDARTSDRHVAGDDVVAWALEAIPTVAVAKDLADECARSAAAGRPVCLLAPPTATRGGARAAIERAAALAYLRAHGAALAHDVDIWLEAVVALVRYGMPSGPRTAVIAPPGSWLEAQVLALVAEAEQAGSRAPFIARGAKGEEPTDAVLFDPSLGSPPSQLPGMHVPVVARGELGDGSPGLYTARAAVGAIEMLGLAAERIAVGLGPAAVSESASLEVNKTSLERELARLPGKRAGDHETKTLLRAYGAPITRQAIAQTPSAAVKVARQVNYPVELKAWGLEMPTEAEGCPVERGVTSDALVRRAFASVLAAAGISTTAPGAAVIVREPPPLGRELVASFVKLPALGWTVIVDAKGAPAIAAAPAPLRLIDAQTLAGAVVASRAGDPEPDRTGLANLLRRASHLVVDLDERIVRLELSRIVVGGRGSRTVVVDAWCELA